VLVPVLFKLLARDPALLFIVVPHEPTVEHLEALEERFAGRERTLRFSHLQAFSGERVLLVDSIGILLPLYASADVAVVGGGFRSNVHNTLEPAAYGIPVLFGPRIAHSREAEELAAAGGGFVVRSRRECYRVLRGLLADDALRAAAGERAGRFVHDRAGSTTRIIARLLPYL
jgi:3-deoxy-D-manno-octulosonic-acid transferase